LAEFRRRRDELAAGGGVPVALAHSPGASRQWVSDELAQAAHALSERTRAEGDLWLGTVWRRTVVAVWGAVVVLLIGQAPTARFGAGCTTGRPPGWLAALVAAGLLSAAAWLHRARGGVLAPVVGEDNRLSTSRTVAAAWVLLVCYAVLLLALELATASD